MYALHYAGFWSERQNMENQKYGTIRLGYTISQFSLFKTKGENLIIDNVFRCVFIIFGSEHYCSELLTAANSNQFYQPGDKTDDVWP
jgi:hypothetical protein